MAIHFENTGYLNYDKKYNKVLKSGAVTVSMSVSNKQQDGTYKNGYINGIIPKAQLTDEVKEALKKDSSVLMDVEGLITMNGAYANFVALAIDKHEKNNDNKKEEDDPDLPF